MKKANILASLVFLGLSITVYTQEESTQYEQTDSKPTSEIQLNQNAQAIAATEPILEPSNEYKLDDPDTQDTPESLMGYFSQVVNSFFNIFQNPHSLEEISTNIANMVSNFVHIVIDAIKKNELPPEPNKEDIMRYINNMSPETKAKMAQLIVMKKSNLTAYKYSKGNASNTKSARSNSDDTQEEEEQAVDETTQVVLGHFNKIVNNFFSIIQNPHEVENVGNNVADMLSNIVHIGTQVMKKNKLSINAYKDEVYKHIGKLNLDAKIKMSKLVIRQARRLQIIDVS